MRRPRGCCLAQPASPPLIHGALSTLTSFVPQTTMLVPAHKGFLCLELKSIIFRQLPAPCLSHISLSHLLSQSILAPLYVPPSPPTPVWLCDFTHLLSSCFSYNLVCPMSSLLCLSVSLRERQLPGGRGLCHCIQHCVPSSYSRAHSRCSLTIT